MKFVIAAILFLCIATAEAAVEISPQLKEMREAAYGWTGIPGLMDKLQATLDKNFLLKKFLPFDNIRNAAYSVLDSGVVALLNLVQPLLKQGTDLLQNGVASLLGSKLVCGSSLIDEFYTTLDYVKTALGPKT